MLGALLDWLKWLDVKDWIADLDTEVALLVTVLGALWATV